MRKLYFVALLVLMLAVVSGSATSQEMYNESPMLAEMVEAGDLPPVEERLPANPRVIEPFNEIGQYGGTMRVGFTGNHPGWGGLWYIAAWENLVSWSPDFSGVVPNVAESWEVSEDSREYTFHLREGMRWSDGVPFTADDIMFYIEDVLFNEELLPGGPNSGGWLPTEGAEDFRAEKIDDYTVKFIFANPYGTFLFNIAQHNGRYLAWYPKHWLTQFHIDYNPDGIQALIDAEDGVEDWVGLFNLKASGPIESTNNFWNNLDRPGLHPWIPTSVLGGNTEMTMVRNPYYWKVDSEGNQLPYIDEVIGVSFQDNAARNLALANGDIDWIKDADEREFFFDAMDSGAPINIGFPVSDSANTNSVHFNLNTQDPALAEIFNDINFRIGMSYAINREEIIEIAHAGQGTPSQVAPLESSPLYNERLSQQYTEYDVELANEYLDMVAPERDDEGYRLRSDGERLSFVFTVPQGESWQSNWLSVAELLIGYWEEVGVEVLMNVVANEVFTEQREDNNLEAVIYTGEGGAGITAILEPRYFVPGEEHGLFGNGWFYWRINSATGTQIEPPQEIQDIRNLYNAVTQNPTRDGQISAMAEILDITAENFWVLGISTPPASFQPYHVRLGNQVDGWVKGWIEGGEKLILPEQWYIIQ